MCGNTIKFPSETNGNSAYCGDEVYKYWSVFTQGRCFFFTSKCYQFTTFSKSGYIRSGPYFSSIWINLFITAYLSNGCYSVNSCGGSTTYGNVFVESLTQSQCNQSAPLFSTATCWKGCSYNQIQSTNMNVETCLQVCNKYDFTYAGLTTYIMMLSFLN